jgi:DNA-binding GntR family transcriptional regulator
MRRPSPFTRESIVSASTVSPIPRTRLHDAVLKSLRDMILRGDLAPGTRVPERALCEQLQISRTPLREALKVLASSGLVDLQPNRGAWIAPLRAAEVEETFEVLSLLERRAGEMAVPHLDDRAIAGLRRLQETLVGHLRAGGGERLLHVDLAIHRTIVEAAGNRTLSGIHEELAIKVERARYLVTTSLERIRQSTEEHEAILAAVVARDPQRVADALYTHCLNTRDAVVAAVRARFPEDERRPDAA